jgi:transcriptional regulator with XRE-family HTH domain
VAESDHPTRDEPSLYEAYREFTAGDLLRALLKSRNLTSAELAVSAKVSHSAIADILAGRRRPTHKAAKALGAFFKVDPAAFF